MSKRHTPEMARALCQSIDDQVLAKFRGYHAILLTDRSEIGARMGVHAIAFARVEDAAEAAKKIEPEILCTIVPATEIHPSYLRKMKRKGRPECQL